MLHVIVVGRQRGADMKLYGPFPTRENAIAWASVEDEAGRIDHDWQVEPIVKPGHG